MKKWWKTSMLTAIACAAVLAATAAPNAATPEGTPENVVKEPVAAAAGERLGSAEAASSRLDSRVEADTEAAVFKTPGITCTFKCNDGIGLLYSCPDSGLGTCCSQAQPACAAHDGLDSGICKRGRLGLSCVPL